MFDFFRRDPWFLPLVEYTSVETLLPSLKELVIAPADAMAEQLIQELDRIRKPRSPRP